MNRPCRAKDIFSDIAVVNAIMRGVIGRFVGTSDYHQLFCILLFDHSLSILCTVV